MNNGTKKKNQIGKFSHPFYVFYCSYVLHKLLNINNYLKANRMYLATTEVNLCKIFFAGGCFLKVLTYVSTFWGNNLFSSTSVSHIFYTYEFTTMFSICFQVYIQDSDERLISRSFSCSCLFGWLHYQNFKEEEEKEIAELGFRTKHTWRGKCNWWGENIFHSGAMIENEIRPEI